MITLPCSTNWINKYSSFLFEIERGDNYRSEELIPAGNIIWVHHDFIRASFIRHSNKEKICFCSVSCFTEQDKFWLISTEKTVWKLRLSYTIFYRIKSVIFFSPKDYLSVIKNDENSFKIQKVTFFMTHLLICSLTTARLAMTIVQYSIPLYFTETGSSID